jgi:hypothetical protein
MDRNRHGVPTYRGPEPTCVWPRCMTKQRDDLPLCGAHASIVAHQVHIESHPQCRIQEEPQAPIRPARRDGPGWIYYVKTDGHYKIGYATNVAARMKAYPPTSVLLAQHRGTMKDERDIHQRFAAYRVAGREWFRISPELDQYIDGVIAVHGRCVDVFERNREKRPQPVQMRHRTQAKR